MILESVLSSFAPKQAIRASKRFIRWSRFLISGESGRGEPGDRDIKRGISCDSGEIGVAWGVAVCLAVADGGFCVLGI